MASFALKFLRSGRWEPRARLQSVPSASCGSLVRSNYGHAWGLSTEPVAPVWSQGTPGRSFSRIHVQRAPVLSKVHDPCLPRTERCLEVSGGREPGSGSVKSWVWCFKTRTTGASCKLKRLLEWAFCCQGVRMRAGRGLGLAISPPTHMSPSLLNFSGNLQSGSVVEGGKL